MRRRRSVPLTDGVTHAHSVLEAHGWISGSCYPAENVGQWHPSRNQIYKCVKLMNLLCVIYRYETCIVIEYRDPFFLCYSCGIKKVNSTTRRECIWSQSTPTTICETVFMKFMLNLLSKHDIQWEPPLYIVRISSSLYFYNLV